MTSKAKAIEALEVFKTVYKNSLNEAKEKKLYLVGASSIENSIKTIENYLTKPTIDDAIKVVEDLSSKFVICSPYTEYVFTEVLTALKGLKVYKRFSRGII